MKVPISWSYLLIPLFILELYVFSLGCAFILSTLYVKVRDIDFIWDIVTRAGFYAVGVLFPMSRIFEKSHKAGEILLLNPVAQTLNDARHALIGDALDPKHITSQSGAVILIPLGITLLTVLVGAIYFRKKSAYFAEDV
jgi:ABC-2 type transport system permease protein